MGRGRLLLAALILGAGLVSYFSSRQVNPVTGETQAISLTPQQEVMLGLRAAPEMAQQFGGEDPDANVQERVRGVGRRLVSTTVASRTPYQFRFTALADPRTVNAFALPGGPIFITRALLDRLENEAQLAGVLGHEIGHVVGRHSAERIAKSQLGQAIIGAVGVATSDDYGRGNPLAQAAAAVVVQMKQLSYGRQDELQSDALGVGIMAEAGYDPRALITVMDILAKASAGRRQPEWMSSHPDPGNRRAQIQAAIDKRYPGGVPGELTLGGPAAAGAAASEPRRLQRP